MDVGDGSGDARTFRVNFSSAGVAKLREEVKEKLKEFMGDYTDDTLVEYVIVLLKNGRRKDEARNELNVFLDDDSHSFVSWLWDHLGSNLNLYVQAQESQADEASKFRPPTIGEDTSRNDSHQAEAESGNVKLSKSSRPRHNREWKGLVRDEAEHPPSHSYEFENTHVEKESCAKVGNEIQSVSTEPVVHRKRRRPEEQQQNKKEVASQGSISASRRLLQFAVRDAVATSKPSTSTTEPSQKRLRSVVSTSMEYSNTEERPHRIHSGARLPNAMAAAIKAVAEAAKDVKVRSSGNVFDRLGRASHVSDTLNQLPEFVDDDAAAVGEAETYGNIRERARATYDRRNDYDKQPYPGNSSLRLSNTRMADPASHDVDHDRRVFRQRVVDTSQTVTSSGHKGENSLAAPCRLAESAEDLALKSGKNQGPPGPISNPPHKINTSGNANTWKSSQYQGARENFEIDSRKFVQLSEVAPKSGVQLMKQKNDHVVSTNGSAKLEAGLQKESQNNDSSLPGPNPISRQVVDADSRTIFVNNVHFAATKDSLSRHFNKFGDVLKVIILIDATTGQPKGSAYVEFTRKEAADSALSLDGTSFMSRILKVVRKSSVQLEATSLVTWPRVARASPFSRFGRVHFPRGIPGAYRTRLSIKPGARSMQWKRDALSEVPGPGPANSIPSSTPRSLTYVRTETKSN